MPKDARLAYFFGTMQKVRILENVTTGEIGKITELVHKHGWNVKKVVTNPSDSWPAVPTHCTSVNRYAVDGASESLHFLNELGGSWISQVLELVNISSFIHDNFIRQNTAL